MSSEDVDQPIVNVVRYVAHFSRRVKCRTVSNALLKSSEMTMTYGFVRSMLLTVLKMEMIAAVDELAGRKTN